MNHPGLATFLPNFDDLGVVWRFETRRLLMLKYAQRMPRSHRRSALGVLYGLQWPQL